MSLQKKYKAIVITLIIIIYKILQPIKWHKITVRQTFRSPKNWWLTAVHVKSSITRITKQHVFLPKIIQHNCKGTAKIL